LDLNRILHLALHPRRGVTSLIQVVSSSLVSKRSTVVYRVPIEHLRPLVRSTFSREDSTVGLVPSAAVARMYIGILQA